MSIVTMKCKTWLACSGIGLSMQALRLPLPATDLTGYLPRSLASIFKFLVNFDLSVKIPNPIKLFSSFLLFSMFYLFFLIR